MIDKFQNGMKMLIGAEREILSFQYLLKLNSKRIYFTIDMCDLRAVLWLQSFVTRDWTERTVVHGSHLEGFII